MSLSVKDRIRKRRAIEGVSLDKDFVEISQSDYIFRKLFFSVNLSDFKEDTGLR